ncbi:MAG: hypothetical protein KKE24_01630 [Candidatus Thermoplasmatota archaeon]|nr:hypothetical protein [Candidatus Thermoplasmatota archaeon]
MSDSSKAPETGTNEIDENKESIAAPKKAGMGSTAKLIALAVIVVLLVAVPMGYMLTQNTDDEPEDEETLVTLEGKTATDELTAPELAGMDYLEEESSYQNSFGNWKGFGTYRGVELRDLADLVGGMESGDIMTVTAADGYGQNLSYDQVYAEGECLEIQGQIILAYMFNGTDIPEWESGPMIAVLSPDGAFSNDDLNETVSDEPEFSSTTSAGSLWVKNVASIKITTMAEGATVLTITKDQTSIDLTMEELNDMTATTAPGGFKKTTGTIEGPSEFTGIPLTDFVDLLYAGTDYSLEVVATDGYTMAYSSGQVEDGTFAYYDPEDGSLLGEGDFTMIVAYAQDGLPLEDMDLRIAIVDESGPITDGHFWAKYVRSLTILPFMKDWTLNLSGVTDLQIDRQTFESVASCEYHAASWTFVNETGTHEYTGVALWTLVSAVDGADGPATDYLFNDLLAKAGYNVTVVASDGFGADRPFDSLQVARNDTLIVANRLDGEPLSEDDDEFPLKLVGDGLTSGQRIKSIANISIVDMHEVPTWTLNLTGLTSAVITAETYVATYYSGLHAKNFTYTDYGGVHAVYYNYTDSEEVAHTYAGIPLWLLVAVMDGTDESHYELNSTLAAEGYDIVLTASDSYSVTIDSATAAFNDTLVLAFMLDGEMLTDMAPLRLVNEFLPGSMKISNVVDIDLENLPI